MRPDPRILRLILPLKRPAALSVAAGVLSAAALIAQAWLLSRIVAAAFFDGASRSSLTPIFVALGAAIVLRAGTLFLERFLALRVARAVQRDLRRDLLTHLFRLGPWEARSGGSGALATTVLQGVDALEAYLGRYLPQVLLAVLVPLAILTVVFPIDLLSGVVLLVTAPLIPFFMTLIGRSAQSLRDRQWTVLQRLGGHFLEMLQGLPTLKLFDRARERIADIRAVSAEFRRTTMGVLRVAFLSALALEVIATISVAVVAVEIGLRLLYGRLDFQHALFVLILAPELYLPLRELGARFHAGMEGVAAAGSIVALLDRPVPAGPAAPLLPPDPAAHSIRFSGVTVTYPGRDHPALADADLTLAPGERVALVGPSGAGKTTLARLLLGLVRPEHGEIRIGATRLADIDPAAWRERLAWISQSPHLFHGSIADNIRLGNPHAGMDDVFTAARRAEIHDEITAFPGGYDTAVGERGARLSGGQAQRIALARAFLRDAPLVILDEPTAHLDVHTERRVQAAIAGLLKGRTAVIIAHRLATVRAVDRIVVLDGGRIVQMGHHAELMRRPGLYRDLAGAREGAP